MNRHTIRVATATAIAAIAIGTAGTAAHAATAPQPLAQTAPALTSGQARTLLATPELASQLSADEQRTVNAVASNKASQVEARSAASSAAKAAFALIKKQGGKFYDSAVSAAKKGSKSFVKWAGDLKWYHPVRLAVSALGGYGVDQLIKLLISG
ncbi:hypothetical protein NLX86_07260 [Streptomyces sp. A3M-1-3]|uniref:hypothetical protein n=1 Tax=Streptomyces sp. A3M-1-3 TaxID=2962044 RepID=UPI0020B66D94|nr:hypothetical protein [Streptomyces sp. A3M-1-3]MCP3817938.1 hypothetical protein [Streptomyces sp. A3M-1-3]